MILAGLLLSAGFMVVLATEGLGWENLGGRPGVLLAAALGGLCLSAVLTLSIARIHARLERLRGHIALAASDIPLLAVVREARDSIDRLHLAVADLIGRRRIAQAELVRRLEQILGALPDPVLVVTSEGLISLVNAAGRALFDGPSSSGGASRVGSSVYDMLTPMALAAAMGIAAAGHRDRLPAGDERWSRPDCSSPRKADADRERDRSD